MERRRAKSKPHGWYRMGQRFSQARRSNHRSRSPDYGWHIHVASCKGSVSGWTGIDLLWRALKTASFYPWLSEQTGLPGELGTSRKLKTSGRAIVQIPKRPANQAVAVKLFSLALPDSRTHGIGFPRTSSPFLFRHFLGNEKQQLLVTFFCFAQQPPEL